MYRGMLIGLFRTNQKADFLVWPGPHNEAPSQSQSTNSRKFMGVYQSVHLKSTQKHMAGTYGHWATTLAFFFIKLPTGFDVALLLRNCKIPGIYTQTVNSHSHIIRRSPAVPSGGLALDCAAGWCIFFVKPPSRFRLNGPCLHRKFPFTDSTDRKFPGIS